MLSVGFSAINCEEGGTEGRALCLTERLCVPLVCAEACDLEGPAPVILEALTPEPRHGLLLGMEVERRICCSWGTER